MSIFSQVIDHACVRWRSILLPIGFVLALEGNKLYDTPYRIPGLFLFSGGLVLSLYGQKFWMRPHSISLWRRLAPTPVLEWMDAQREKLDDQRSKPEWTRARGDLNTGVWFLAMVVVMAPVVGLLDMIALDPSRVTDYAWDTKTAAVLMCIWIGLPLFTRWIEPTDSPLDRLAGRAARATITRMVSNTAGIGYVSVLIYAKVFTIRPSLLVPMAVTLGGIVIVSGHKTWTRLRKLFTQLYSNVRTLERDLNRIHGNKESGTGEKQDAARRSWDAVELDLRTSVDTGYAFGVPLLPHEAIENLREAVEKAIEAMPDDKDTAEKALDSLGKIRQACRERVDSVA
ncbi:hypothetical protein ABZ628_32030 [Streptomyces diastaticus]|uniref:hypothetical protein n=1 Tax=Streptomyces diastaticus TaxID=1956 RepID=UPI00340F5409